MGTLLEFIILLFLTLLAISLLGLVWSFIRKKPKRRWMIGLAFNLLLLITSAVFYNNYLLSQEHKEYQTRYNQQQQAAAAQNKKTGHFQTLTTQKLDALAQTIADKAEAQNLKNTEDEIKSDLAMLTTKMDELKDYLTKLMKQKTQH